MRNELLQSKEVPRSFRRVRGMDRIGELFQWRVPENRQHQNAECATSSCSPRKYHGAFAGFGGWTALANSSSGAFQKIASTRTLNAQRAPAVQGSTTELSPGSGDGPHWRTLPVARSRKSPAPER